jgi:hypothetical protein
VPSKAPIISKFTENFSLSQQFFVMAAILAMFLRRLKPQTEDEGRKTRLRTSL